MRTHATDRLVLAGQLARFNEVAERLSVGVLFLGGVGLGGQAAWRGSLVHKQLAG